MPRERIRSSAERTSSRPAPLPPLVGRHRNEAQIRRARVQRPHVRAADKPALERGREHFTTADRLGDLATPGPRRILEPQSGLTDGVCPVDDAGELLDENLITGLVGGKELDLNVCHEGRAVRTPWALR
jgi:hypothetical protein